MVVPSKEACSAAAVTSRSRLRGQDPTFSEYLLERTGGVDAPRVEGGQKGWSIDESLSKGEEAQEEAPVDIVLGHEQVPSVDPHRGG